MKTPFRHDFGFWIADFGFKKENNFRALIIYE
jgi:hypothetical protein